jgi:hypothetical protein
MMMLVLVAPVVPTPSPLSVRSTSPSSQAAWTPLFLLAHVVSGSHVSSRSHLASAKDMSESSPVYITTDSEDDHRHGYTTPIPESQKPMIRASCYGLLVCPLCPESAPRGWTQSIIREHVLAWANRRPHGTYAVDKKIARHHALATN